MTSRTPRKFLPKFCAKTRAVVVKFRREYLESGSPNGSDWSRALGNDPSIPESVKIKVCYLKWVKSGGEAIGSVQFNSLRYKWLVDYENLRCVVCGKGHKDGSGKSWPFNHLYRHARKHIDQPPMFCSRECALSSDHVASKREQTCIRKFGARCVFASDEMKERIKQTNLKELGYENPMCRGSPVRRKWQKNLIHTHGVDNYMKADFVKDRVRATHQKNGGNPLQRPEIYKKVLDSSLRSKSMVIEGKKFDGLMGFEPPVIEWLVQAVGLDRVLAGRSAVVPYKYTLEGVERMYYPDAVLLRNGKPFAIVEVKSSFTLGVDNYRYPAVRAKSKAVTDLGLLFVLCVPMSSSAKRMMCRFGALPSKTQARRSLRRFKKSEKTVPSVSDFRKKLVAEYRDLKKKVGNA